MATYREHQRIKSELRIKCKEAYNNNWEHQINHISDNCKNRKEFWNKIKILKGKNTTYTNYMKDSEGKKHYTDKEKCNLMEQTGKNVFRISEQEENNFDKHHSELIDRFIQAKSNKVKPYPTVDLSRVNTEDFHSRKM